MQNDNENVDVVNGDSDYIETIKELKNNTVSKELYQEALDKNKKLLEALKEGKQVEEQPKRSKEDLIKVIKDEHTTNQDFVKASLELREIYKEETGKDLFIPNCNSYVPQDSDNVAAEKVATIFSECLEYAEGDAQAFTNELQRRTNDTPMSRRR